MEGALVLSSSSSDTPTAAAAQLNNNTITNNTSSKEPILFGSGAAKRDRSLFNSFPTEEESREWRFGKVGKSDSMAAANSYFRSKEGPQMLSFASPNNDSSLHYSNYCAFSNQSYFRNEGIGNATSMMQGGGAAAMARIKGPFTPSQWMELEHQALIYKHLAASVPVPPSLLFPIRRSLASSGSFASAFPSAYLGSSASGWGGHPYTMGYALTMTGGGGGGDAEPGRCRRTDGKKWRCSRDAVADQKYCERHINRGRHRSRKHVEPPHSHNDNNNSNRLSSASTKLAATCSSPSTQIKTNDITTTALSASCSDPPLDRTLVDGDQESSLSLLTPMLPFANQPDHHPPTSPSEYGSHTLLRHFIHTFPELHEEETHSSTPQLSISISTPSPSVGGPLGEVLNKNRNIRNDNIYMLKDQSKELNLLTDGWDLDLSPRHVSSPTGVLQKSSLGSLSSSAGSSPRPESYNKSQHEDLGSILVNHLSKISYA